MDKFLTIGDRIKIKRKEMGYTQEALAEKAGIGRASIGQIESGHIMPSLQFLSKFVQICNTSYSYIIDGDENASGTPAPTDYKAAPDYAEMIRVVRKAQKMTDAETGGALEELFISLISQNMSLKDKLIKFHEGKNRLIEKIRKEY